MTKIIMVTLAVLVGFAPQKSFSEENKGISPKFKKDCIKRELVVCQLYHPEDFSCKLRAALMCKRGNDL